MKSARESRRYYLDDIPLEEAARRFHEALEGVGALEPAPSEPVALDRASGRVTAEPVWARMSSPHYDAAGMDGVAVRSDETVGATETSPVQLKVGEQAVWLDTGDPIPDGFDAVVMVEVVHEVAESVIELQAPVAPYQHVRPIGEDIAATELVLPQNHRMRPQDVAACASAGLAEVAVRRSPRVAVIPTGTELVPVGSAVEPGDIVETNSLMLAAMIREWGADVVREEVVPDDFAQLRAAVLAATESFDLVVVNAGSSAGSADFTSRVVEDLGNLVVHGVAVRPGHPVVLGVVRQKPVLGIPGFPVSAALTCELFVKPLIERRLGVSPQKRQRTAAVLTRKLISPMGEDEFIRVRLGRVGEKMFATPIQRGAGIIMSLVRADGLLVIPRFSEGIDAGQDVDVELLRSVEEIEGAIVAIGSHDVVLDLLASELSRRHPERRLASSNVGSLGGLLALSRGEAHLAGCHLLDETSGEYNVPAVRRYVKGRNLVLMNLVRRVQGLIVPQGNPQSIASLGDLGRDSIRFINRQRGSGTRLLLDHMLNEAVLSPLSIVGYEREAYTHLAVAAAVAGGGADVGLGILSAARAMDLDFVPLATEQYDLVIPREFYDAELLGPLISLIRSHEFKAQVEALGGYDTTSTGDIVAELG